jgi:hypothetical protein
MHACSLPTVKLATAAAAALQDFLSCTLSFFAASQVQRALSAPQSETTVWEKKTLIAACSGLQGRHTAASSEQDCRALWHAHSISLQRQRNSCIMALQQYAAVM